MPSPVAEHLFDETLDIANDENDVLLGGASAEMICPWKDVFRPDTLTPYRVRFRIGDGSTSTESTHKGTVDL